LHITAPKKQAVVWIDITDDESGQRIDNFLLNYLKGVPKSYIYRILRKGEVRVNKKRIKPLYRLKKDDKVRIPPMVIPDKKLPPLMPKTLLERLKDCIIYENEQLIIINKPTNIAVHGGSGISLAVIEAFRQIYPDVKRLELVHRLDKATSGCLILAKTRPALLSLQNSLRQRDMQKVYLTLVHGIWPKRKTLATESLVKKIMPHGERRVFVNAEGKESRTEFKVIHTFDNASLLAVRLITGRTHQIRVHTAYHGHPIIGDDKYGIDEVNDAWRKQGAKRLFLHAWQLRFDSSIDLPLPSSIIAPLQSDMLGVLKRLGCDDLNDYRDLF